MKKEPICQYRCLDKSPVKTCGFEWDGYRMMPEVDKNEDVVGYRKESGPGMTVCPKCKAEQVEWVNFEEWEKWAKKEGIR